MLVALLGEVDHAERIICVEDAAELSPNHPHVVRLVARAPNVEGGGEVTVCDLVRQALRMRPDGIVVGEVLGGEVDLLTAMNTGHDGGAGAVHANSTNEVPARLEALAANNSFEPTRMAVSVTKAAVVGGNPIRVDHARRTAARNLSRRRDCRAGGKPNFSSTHD